MQRYVHSHNCDRNTSTMRPDWQGGWVNYADHVAALADRDAQWERAVREAFRATPAMRHEDMAIAAIRQRLRDAEPNPSASITERDAGDECEWWFREKQEQYRQEGEER